MPLFFEQDGKPFFPLGGQANNSSAYNAGELTSAIAGVTALGGNTLEAPVYWSQVEPEEGQFCFAAVDMLVEESRKAGLRLVILWFGTWKNGEMRYTPEWVKRDRRRFRRVMRSDGTQMQVLSAYCAQSQAADCAAFRALMTHLKAIDGEQRTVFAVQVENEAGILGSDRDYGPEATAALREQVPGELVNCLDQLGCGPTWQAWKACQALVCGRWEELFGQRAAEFREAWAVAKFVDAVAAAGKSAYNLPMYANVWLGEQGWQIPGQYPCGGPVGRTLDIWKCAAPNLDLIAPDIYIANHSDYRKICDLYNRPDNPLFVPESGPNDQNALNMMRAIADYDAVGYCCFAIDTVLTPDGQITKACKLYSESFRSVKNALPLVVKYHSTGRIHSVVQESFQPNQQFEFDKYIGLVDFGKNMLHYHLDHRYTQDPSLAEDRPCFGLIFEAGPGEFYLVGNFRLYMVRKKSPEWNMALMSPLAFSPDDHLTVEEGWLDEEGNFTATRERNGDEASWASFWVTPHCGVVRVRLNVVD